MCLHRGALLRAQASTFEQKAIGERELADVVEWRCLT